MPDCLFCKIAAHEISVNALYEDEQSLAFADINPQAPKHVLFIPKRHFESVEDAPAELLGHLLAQVSVFAGRVLPDGHRIVVNTGADGGQTVHHLHLHLLGGRSMSWPPG